MEYYIHSLGGQETATINRNDALSQYYANPRLCLKCNAVIIVKPNSTAAETRRRKFCSRECSSQYREESKVSAGGFN